MGDPVNRNAGANPLRQGQTGAAPGGNHVNADPSHGGAAPRTGQLGPHRVQEGSQATSNRMSPPPIGLRAATAPVQLGDATSRVSALAPRNNVRLGEVPDNPPDASQASSGRNLPVPGASRNHVRANEASGRNGRSAVNPDSAAPGGSGPSHVSGDTERLFFKAGAGKKCNVVKVNWTLHGCLVERNLDLFIDDTKARLDRETRFGNGVLNDDLAQMGRSGFEITEYRKELEERVLKFRADKAKIDEEFKKNSSIATKTEVEEREEPEETGQKEPALVSEVPEEESSSSAISSSSEASDCEDTSDDDAPDPDFVEDLAALNIGLREWQEVSARGEDAGSLHDAVAASLGGPAGGTGPASRGDAAGGDRSDKPAM